MKYEIDAPWTRNIVPDHALGYRMSPYFAGHDRHGFRNDGESTSYDVVAIGDSVTYGFGADAHGSWPRLLSVLSKRSVYNAGVGGYGPCEYYRLVDEMMRYRPQLVTLGLYLGNDLANAYTSVYTHGRCPELSTKDPSTLRAIERENQRVDLQDVARQYGDDEPQALRPGLHQRSAIYGLVRSLRYRLTAPRGLRGMLDDSFDAAARRPFRVALERPSAFRTVFRDPRLDTLALDTSDARMQEGLRVLLTATEAIHTKLRERGIALAVVILHNKPYVMSELIHEQRPDLWPRFETLVALEVEATKRLVEFFDERAIPYLDTGGEMREAIRKGSMPFHESDDHHPNAAGYRLIAEAAWQSLGRAMR